MVAGDCLFLEKKEASLASGWKLETSAQEVTSATKRKPPLARNSVVQDGEPTCSPPIKKQKNQQLLQESPGTPGTKMFSGMRIAFWAAAHMKTLIGLVGPISCLG